MSEPENSALNEGGESTGPWQLPAELKPIEAELAALRPRQDRLQRERLIFLAGQASAAEVTRPGRAVLGVNLRHEAWPAAFAGMTAVAATLLVLLITQPATVERPSLPPIGIAGSNTAPRADDIREVRNVLSTGDVYRLDVDDLLARSDTVSADAQQPTATTPGRSRPGPSLTPASWEQIFEGDDSAGPSSDDSADRNLISGALS